MGYTISVHHGGGKAHRDHNIRNEKAVANAEHIDQRRPHEVWRDETEASAYKRLFGEATARYNANQSRKERRIRSYHAEVEKNSKMHTSYECIIQIGNRDNQPDPETERAILKRFIEEWPQRNPNLDLYGVYFHLDEEGGNHIHADYIPVAHGYERGMDTQAGLVRALAEQGYEKQGRVTAQMQWQESERQALESICREFGLEIEHPTTEKRQHMETEQYKATRQLEETLEAVEVNKECAAELQGRIEEKKHQEQKLDKKIETKREAVAKLDGDVKEARKLRKEQSERGFLGRRKKTVTIPYEEYRTLQKTARAVESVQKTQEALTEREADLDTREANLRPQEDDLEFRKRQLKYKQENLEATIETTVKRRVDAERRNILERAGGDYTERLEAFVKQYNVKGESLLEIFAKQERELRRSMNRGWER